MTDLIILKLEAGDGGNGRVSFRREKYVAKGGPSGGQGGNGGDVIIRGTRNMATLKKYAGQIEYSAADGNPGGSKQMSGHKGDSIVLEVPVGTEIWAAAENELARKRRMILGINQLWKRNDIFPEKYYVEKEGQQPPVRPEDPWVSALEGEIEAKEDDELIRQAYKNPQKVKLATITEHGQEVILCQGGFGGRGNESFKSSVNTTPLEAEYGTIGEKRLIVFELKLLADVGLVGFPNAGKSTLLSVLTKARPKIANYPFTTLEPHLGVMSSEDGKKEVVIADIPGLIEGASEGKGLGLDFLRHVENCSFLLFVLSLDETVVFDESLTDEMRAQRFMEQFDSLSKELAQHGRDVSSKPFKIAVNKTDLYSEELIDTVRSLFAGKDMEVQFISAATGQNLDELSSAIFSSIDN